jgi:hypothetical protein
MALEERDEVLPRAGPSGLRRDKVAERPPIKLELRTPDLILVLRWVWALEIGRKPGKDFVVCRLREGNSLLIPLGDEPTGTVPLV